MDTERKNQHISIAFINDKSPVIDVISKDLLTFGFKILFKSENIEVGLAHQYHYEQSALLLETGFLNHEFVQVNSYRRNQGR